MLALFSAFLRRLGRFGVRAISLGFLFAGALFAQTGGFIQLYQVTSASSQQFQNNNPRYNAWTVMYNYSGSGSFSIELDCAADATTPGGTPTPGSYSACTNVITGSNPSTSPNFGYITFVGYTPWLELNLTSLSSGNMTAVAWGFNPADPEGAGSGGGCASPCKVIQNQPGNTTASWTSATALNTTVSVALAGYANVNVLLFNTGTISSGAVTFEISPDNSNWQAIGMGPLTTNTGLQTTYPLANGTNGWQMFTGGFAYFRVRLSTVIGGSGTAAFFLTPSVFGTEFAEAVGNATAANLQAQVQGVINEGSAPTFPPVPVAVRGGTGNITSPTNCTQHATFDTSSSGNTLVITGTGGSTVRICKLSFQDVAGGNTEILQQGTGSTCGTSTTNLWMTYVNVAAVAEDFVWPLVATISDNVCINLANATRVTGAVTYALY